MSNVERRKPCDVQLPPPPPPAAAAADVLLMRLQGGDAVSSDGKLEYNRFAEPSRSYNNLVQSATVGKY